MLQEHDLARIVGPLHNACKVHGVVDLILCLKHLFEAKVVVTFLECVKGDVLVVPIVDVLAYCARSRVR